MADQPKPATPKFYESAPSTRQTVKILTAATIGALLMVLSGLTLTGTVIVLIMATPALVLFSPILLPAVITLMLLTTGFMFSCGCGVAAATAFSWIYRYVTGNCPIGADKLDYVRMMIADKARDMKEIAKDQYGHYVQQKTQETTTQTTT